MTTNDTRQRRETTVTRWWLGATEAHPAVILIRLAVGGTFLSEGIQKFVFPDA